MQSFNTRESPTDSLDHLRSRTWAPQPKELRHRRPATPHRSGAKARSNSYKYLQRGTSSGASFWASKCQRSPSPSPRKDNHPSAHRSRGNCHEARPPGQLHRSSLETEEEIRNLKMELQRFHDYGHQDQETIQYLEKCLVV